jgi:hypothetical protein
MIKINPMRVSDVAIDIVQKCHICAHYYHQREMVRYEGHWYCPEDYTWRFEKERLHESRIRIEDDSEHGR